MPWSCKSLLFRWLRNGIRSRKHTHPHSKTRRSRANDNDDDEQCRQWWLLTTERKKEQLTPFCVSRRQRTIYLFKTKPKLILTRRMSEVYMLYASSVAGFHIRKICTEQSACERAKVTRYTFCFCSSNGK